MRILLVNKYNHITGGADTYFFALRRMLLKYGHEVAEFCLDSPENQASDYKKYFVFGLTSKNWNSTTFLKSMRTFVNSIYNFEAKKKFKDLVEYFNPDIVHIQNIFYQISPSILSVAKKKKIPVIETLHDYHLVCANSNLYHHGKVCEDCLRGPLHSILKNKCYNSSLKASLLAYFSFLSRKIFRTYERKVSYWISPSDFLRSKMTNAGIDSQKIGVVPGFIQTDEPEHNKIDKDEISEKEFVLFLGRLEEQKGIWTLIKAAEILKELKFKIAGEGSIKENVAAYVRERNLANIELLGFAGASDAESLIRRARLMVVPSEWYEVFGLVILESYKYGKPVVASETGGIPEIVSYDSGILFDPGDPLQLAESIRILYYSPGLRNIMGQKAIEKVKKEYSEEVHYRKIMTIYREQLKSNGKA